MHHSAYNKADMVNGPGCRISIFVSGCAHACPGCYNQKTWRSDFGEEWTQHHLTELLNDLDNDFIDGITLTGGDPLYEGNLQSIETIIDAVRMYHPSKTIWMWTGYTLTEIKADAYRKRLVDKIDVLVDGQFVQELFSPNLEWRGSVNQIVWNVQGGDYSISVGAVPTTPSSPAGRGTLSSIPIRFIEGVTAVG